MEINKGYINPEEVIFTHIIDKPWIEEENRVISVESITSICLFEVQQDFPSFIIKIDLGKKDVLEIGVKYEVIWMYSADIFYNFSSKKKQNELNFLFFGGGVNNYFGPRDNFGRKKAEELWNSNTKLEFKYHESDCVLFFNKLEGSTNSNTIDKNGKTINWQIGLTIKKDDNLIPSKIFDLIKTVKNFLFAFLNINYIHITTKEDGFRIHENIKNDINPIELNNYKLDYLGKIESYHNSDIEFFIEYYDFIDILRKNTKPQIQIAILSAVLEKLFKDKFISNFEDREKIKDLGIKMEIMLAKTYDECEDKRKNNIENFKKMRNNLMHGESKSNFIDSLKYVFTKTILLLCYYIKKEHYRYFARRYFYVEDDKLNLWYLKDIIESNLMCDEKTLLSSVLLLHNELSGTKLLEELVLSFSASNIFEYHFNSENDKIFPDNLFNEDIKTFYLLVSIEEKQQDYPYLSLNKEKHVIRYDDLLTQNKSFIEKYHQILKDFSKRYSSKNLKP